MGRPQRYRGVRQRHWGSWVSEIRHPQLKTRVWLGTFETAEDAAHAYDEAARLMCGARARTNFPLDLHAPKRPASQLLSASLREKLHRWSLQSQQQQHSTDASKPGSRALTQSHVCVCQLDHAELAPKDPSLQSEVGHWVGLDVQFCSSPEGSSVDGAHHPTSSSENSSSSSLSEEDKFAAEMIEELLSWQFNPGFGAASPATSDSSCSSFYSGSTLVGLYQ